MKKLKLLIIMVMVLILPFQTVFAATTKTEKVLEKINEILENVNGKATYEDDEIKISYKASSSNVSVFSYQYNENLIEYNPGEINDYDEAANALSNVLFINNLLQASLELHGYSKDEISAYFTSDNTPTLDINGFEIETIGEKQTFESESSSMEMTPMRVKIDITKANLNSATDPVFEPQNTTIQDIADYLNNDEKYTKYFDEEDNLIFEKRVSFDDENIEIEYTDYSYTAYDYSFECIDDVLYYETPELDDYDVVEYESSKMFLVSLMLQYSLQVNGYTNDEIKEFFDKDINLSFEENGIEYKELGDEKSFSDGEGGTITLSPFSIRLDFNRANMGEDKTYTIESALKDDNSISFNAKAGKTYQFDMRDRLSITDDQLQQLANDLNDPEYTFEKLKTMLNNLIEYGRVAAGDGKLLKLYELYLHENGTEIHEVDNGFKIKIKITDDMKGYDSYKLVFIDEDGKTEEPIQLTINGEYLEGTLPHLSMYALIGNTNSSQNNTSNPQTGDNIIFYISMLGLSIVGFVGCFVFVKKNN